jgi:hypothetical protein
MNSCIMLCTSCFILILFFNFKGTYGSPMTPPLGGKQFFIQFQKKGGVIGEP